MTAQKRYAEAEPLLTEGYNELKTKLGDQDRRTVEARQRLEKLYELKGKPRLGGTMEARRALITLYRDWQKLDKAAQVEAKL